MFNWQNFRPKLQQVRYYLIFLIALWLSLGVPGCSFLPPNSQTSSSSPQPTEITVNTVNPTPQHFDGTVINVLTMNGVIGDAVKHHISKFESQTGAKVNLTLVPVNDLYNTAWKDWSSAAPKYDSVVLISQRMTDFASSGYLEDLTERVKTDAALQWQDVAPFFKDFGATYQGRTYAIPLDGDFHMAYYRKDLLEQAKLTPPATWDEYLAIAKRFNQQDLNGDGQPDYGSCINAIDRPAQSKFAAEYFWSIASSFLQTQGTAQGVFFDPETMKPLFNNQAFTKTLEIAKQAKDYGYPPSSSATANQLFIAGRCALAIEWGDIGTLSIDSASSKVVDKVGATITPGTTQVLDRQTGKLVACDRFLCPYAIEGVNHAPYAASGGWAGFVHAKSKMDVKDAAYAFLSFMSQPDQANVDVTNGTTGFNPYRISQFKNQEAWIKAGMSPEAASRYLGGISVSLNNSNMVLDLRIPQNYRYQTEVLGAVITDFLTDKITSEEAMQRIEKGWEKITNELGRESQRAAYRASLGLNPEKINVSRNNKSENRQDLAVAIKARG